MGLFQDRKQAALEKALRVGDLEKFQLAFKNGARADAPVRRSHYTIFETACNTRGRHEFISACFNENLTNPDPRRKNNPVTHEYPIHLAAVPRSTEEVRSCTWDRLF
ncbi:AGAP013463-PA-like protein [Anopheles sinensis]|uniref:AGAP013463-PA-like protein n=1 Tax=Anopheles sinensis TaxID=74873 RepID=A0A084W5D8_ANOSI|nr:AGAP013463-PA-like protein [Anopheles sinensis]